MGETNLAAVFAETAWLLIPLLLGGVLHGLAMKYNWLPWLARPIDKGKTYRGVRLFGDNKTWRGVLCVGLGAGWAMVLECVLSPAFTYRAYHLEPNPIELGLFGLLVGSLAMLGELPNSFLKRRAGIAPGAGGGGAFAWFFYLYDQVDLLLFVAIAWWAVGAFTWPRFALALALVTVIHQVLSSVGYRLGMRKTPR